MRRALFLMKDFPEIKKQTDRISNHKLMMDERLKFIKKQVEDIVEEYTKENEKLWEHVYHAMKESGQWPEDYKREKHSLIFGNVRATIFVLAAKSDMQKLRN